VSWDLAPTSKIGPDPRIRDGALSPPGSKVTTQMEPGFVKKNWPAGPVQVITRMPRLRASTPAATRVLIRRHLDRRGQPGLADADAAHPVPVQRVSGRAVYASVTSSIRPSPRLAANRKKPPPHGRAIPRPHATDDLHNWTICAPLPWPTRPHSSRKYSAFRASIGCHLRRVLTFRNGRCPRRLSCPACSGAYSGGVTVPVRLGW
jgi:hypothetical protein